MTTIEEVETHFRVKAALMGIGYELNAAWLSWQIGNEALIEYQTWCEDYPYKGRPWMETDDIKKMCELYLKYHPE